MRIVFMGTPEFAVPSLAALVASGQEVAAVVTQPDRPAGRALALKPPPVKVYALARGIPVLQPETVRSAESGDAIARLAPDLLVVVAYGQILPRRLLELPRIAPLNVHASLLPRYRGAAPIQWAVINGETETGITVQRMARQLDAGDILLQAREPVDADETAGRLHDRLMDAGARCLLEALELIRNGQARFVPQDAGRVTFAPMLSREMARMDWGTPAASCHNRVRGLNPWPGAGTTFRENACKIWRTARLAPGESPPAEPPRPGLLRLEHSRLLTQCGDGEWLEIREIQAPGRRVTSGPDFGRGLRLREGEQLV